MQNKRRSFLLSLPRCSAKPSAWGSQQPQPLLALRRGFYPIPRPFPSPGEGMQPLVSARSVTKVSATHQRVAGRFLTQQSCDCLCSLRSPQCEKPSNYGSCCDCLCGLFSPQCKKPSNLDSCCDCLCGLCSPLCEKPSNYDSCCDCLRGLCQRLLQLCYMEGAAYIRR